MKARILRSGFAATCLALGLVGLPVHAAPPVSMGQQASQCFVIYKMAAAAPANAPHKGEIAKLGGLMSRTMQDNRVSKAQFDSWTGQLLARIGSREKPNTAVLDREIATCNAFAQQRYAFYNAARK